MHSSPSIVNWVVYVGAATSKVYGFNAAAAKSHGTTRGFDVVFFIGTRNRGSRSEEEVTHSGFFFFTRSGVLKKPIAILCSRCASIKKYLLMLHRSVSC